MQINVVGWSWVQGRRMAAGLASVGLLVGPASAQQTGLETGGTLTLNANSRAQTPSERYNIEPTRTAEPPRLDGVLEDAEWAHAAVIDEFVQQEPSEGDPATERTVVRLMYDEHALYIGVEAYDSMPNAVIATEMRRDSRQLLEEDNFQLILDTFNDQRSGYMFVTSPLGAKLEQQIAEEGEGGYRRVSSTNANVNLDWDGVWDVSARRTDQGWRPGSRTRRGPCGSRTRSLRAGASISCGTSGARTSKSSGRRSRRAMA